ncbi:ABC transporter substrate-binding protein [Microbacterium sp. NC79]|uniref:ABC transporter substrate-binding protein n=1 Tax=Microbacterium sp. NC79 TaxID=2851009 RepID=UPI001C2B9DCC|nr:ABC transporter substrate-binding protein [Microbacterium sp. NC79]MBV0896148.1 ABC transporter substrate-binding protein [Microbacterium sp. NC79]
MRVKPRGLAVLGLFALVATAAACSGPATPAPETEKPAASGAPSEAPADACATPANGEEIVLTVSNPIEGFAPLIIAMESGAFEEAGLNVTVEKISAADSLAQIGQGRFDGQLTSYGAGNFNVVASGIEMKWIAPFYELPLDTDKPLPGYWANTKYVGTADDADLTGLEGQTIGSPTGGTGAGGLVLAQALEDDGLTLDAITFTTISGADALVALENDAVAGTWLSAPFTETAAKNPNLRLAATYQPGLNGSGIIVGSKLLDRPDVLVKFLQVLAETNEAYLQGDYHKNADTLEYLATGLDQEADTIANGVPLIFDATLDMSDAVAYLENLQNFLRSQGALDYAENVPASELMSTEFAEQAASCLK